MGKQSARMIFEGKDHKDIFFNGKYHNAIYRGEVLLWEKLDGILTMFAHKVDETKWANSPFIVRTENGILVHSSTKQMILGKSDVFHVGSGHRIKKIPGYGILANRFAPNRNFFCEFINGDEVMTKEKNAIGNFGEIDVASCPEFNTCAKTKDGMLFFSFDFTNKMLSDMMITPIQEEEKKYYCNYAFSAEDSDFIYFPVGEYGSLWIAFASDEKGERLFGARRVQAGYSAYYEICEVSYENELTTKRRLFAYEGSKWKLGNLFEITGNNLFFTLSNKIDDIYDSVRGYMIDIESGEKRRWRAFGGEKCATFSSGKVLSIFTQFFSISQLVADTSATNVTIPSEEGNIVDENMVLYEVFDAAFDGDMAYLSLISPTAYNAYTFQSNIKIDIKRVKEKEGSK